MNGKVLKFGLVVLAVLTLAALACGSSGQSGGTKATSTPKPRAQCVPQTFNGRGDSVVELPDTLAGCTKVKLTHTGKANFIVVPYDVNNERKMGLCNEIGAYEGTVKWDARAASLEVTADGAWTIAVQK